MRPRFAIVEYARTRFALLWAIARADVARNVNAPTKARAIPTHVWWKRGANTIKRKTPAFTIVDEWRRAETGVGATIAPVSQVENGSCAALVRPATASSASGMVSAATLPYDKRFGMKRRFAAGSMRHNARIAPVKEIPPIKFIHTALNELRLRGYSVDVGIVEKRIKKDKVSSRVQYEIDFIANQGNEKIYIQSAMSIANHQKQDQETKSLREINDNFKKNVIVKDVIDKSVNEDGIIYVNLFDFLLGSNE